MAVKYKPGEGFQSVKDNPFTPPPGQQGTSTKDGVKFTPIPPPKNFIKEEAKKKSSGGSSSSNNIESPKQVSQPQSTGSTSSQSNKLNTQVNKKKDLPSAAAFGKQLQERNLSNQVTEKQRKSVDVPRPLPFDRPGITPKEVKPIKTGSSTRGTDIFGVDTTEIDPTGKARFDVMTMQRGSREANYVLEDDISKRKKTQQSLIDLGSFATVPTAVLRGSQKVSQGSKDDMLIITNPDELGRYSRVKEKLSPKTKEGIAFQGLGGIGAIGGTGAGIGKFGFEGSIVKSSERDVLKDLAGQEFKVTGKKLVNTPEGRLFKIRGERSVQGSAKEEFNFLSAEFDIGKGDVFGVSESGSKVLIKKGDESTSFFIKGGSAKKRFRNPVDQSIVKESDLKFSGQGRARGADAFRIKEKGFIVESSDVKGSYGRGFLDIKGEKGFREFGFVGASRENKGSTSFISGLPKEQGSKSIRGPIVARGEIDTSKTINIFSDDSVGSRIVGSGRKSKGLETSDLKLTQTSKSDLSYSGNIMKELSKSLDKELKIGGKSGFKSGVSTDLKLAQRTTQRTRPFVADLMSQQTRQSGRLNIRPMQGIMPRQLQREDTLSIPRLGNPTTPINRERTPRDTFTGGGFGIPRTPRTPFIPVGGIPLGLPSFKDTGKSGIKGSKSKFKGSYNIDLSSAIFNFKGNLPKGFGFGARPYMIRRKKRK